MLKSQILKEIEECVHVFVFVTKSFIFCQGPMGPVGPMGNAGEVGLPGDPGVRGERGPMGPVGQIVSSEYHSSNILKKNTYTVVNVKKNLCAKKIRGYIGAPLYLNANIFNDLA